MSNEFKGMSGCLRQAVVDAGLQKRFNVDHGKLYNDKQGLTKRRFKWCESLRSDLTEKEEEKYLAALDKRLLSYNLKRTQESITYDSYFGDDITIWCDINETGQIEDLRQKADKLGYKLVKK